MLRGRPVGRRGPLEDTRPAAELGLAAPDPGQAAAELGPEEAAELGHGLDEQRSAVLRTLLAGLALFGLCVTPVVWLEAPVERRGDIRLWALFALLQSNVLLYALRRTLGDRHTAFALLGELALFSTFLVSMRGPSPGSTALHFFLLWLAALFFGKRGAWAGALVCVASIAVGALLLAGGVVEPWSSQFWDPRDGLVWLRYSIVIAILAATLALAHLHVVRGLSDNARQLARALAREREQRRQRELAQAALERAQRHEVLAQLAGGIAHDVANGLMVSSAHAEFIKRSPDATRAIAENADHILETIHGMRGLTRSLLALGRVDVEHIERMRLDRPLAWLEKTLRHTLPPGIALQTQVSTACEIDVDVARLEQALLNLGLNARDAMPTGGELRVEAAERSAASVPPGWLAEPGRFVRVSVSDTGVGMEGDVLERAFEPFFTTKGPGHGTGLGLAVVRRLVYDARGFISVDSKLGLGTTFCLHFPVSANTNDNAHEDVPRAS
jgi:signal transduction histidine kinase